MQRATASSRTSMSGRQAMMILDRLGMTSRFDALPAELSGGEWAWLAAVQALIQRPTVLLADEPTAALDTANSQLMMDLLVEAAREHAASVLSVTHDPVVFDRVDRRIEFRKQA